MTEIETHCCPLCGTKRKTNWPRVEELEKRNRRISMPENMNDWTPEEKESFCLSTDLCPNRCWRELVKSQNFVIARYKREAPQRERDEQSFRETMAILKEMEEKRKAKLKEEKEKKVK